MNIPDKFKHCVETNFTPISIIIKEGAWKNEKGWIIGKKMRNNANPIVLESGISLPWFDSEIEVLKN